MFRTFGFYFPDADCLSDPEGLLRYLVGPKGRCFGCWGLGGLGGVGWGGGGTFTAVLSLLFIADPNPPPSNNK